MITNQLTAQKSDLRKLENTGVAVLARRSWNLKEGVKGNFVCFLYWFREAGLSEVSTSRERKWHFRGLGRWRCYRVVDKDTDDLDKSEYWMARICQIDILIR
ncbi:hypothetical protein Zmor_005276 [Zophobas morio]|uniref:Uncharacterized protein n=1 Tax=Zophobas morio TaxID=2755281 RepID=A0AA38MLJ1_9CUCU|nr:hypothetical protein Zmor_005276 [Zophobas morio]